MRRSKIYTFISHLSHSLDATEQGFSLKKIFAVGYFLFSIVTASIYLYKHATDSAYQIVIDGSHWLVISLIGIAVVDKKIKNKITDDGKPQS